LTQKREYVMNFMFC